MKPVKNLVFAVLLVAILALSTLAGDVQTPGAANPTPNPSPSPDAMKIYDGETVPFCDPNSGSVATETSDNLFYEALVALLSVY